MADGQVNTANMPSARQPLIANRMLFKDATTSYYLVASPRVGSMKLRPAVRHGVSFEAAEVKSRSSGGQTLLRHKYLGMVAGFLKRRSECYANLAVSSPVAIHARFAHCVPKSRGRHRLPLGQDMACLVFRSATIRCTMTHRFFFSPHMVASSASGRRSSSFAGPRLCALAQVQSLATPGRGHLRRGRTYTSEGHGLQALHSRC